MHLPEALDIIAEKFRDEAKTDQEKKEAEAAVVIVKTVLDSLGRIALALEKLQP